jgi:glycosyltransferase involved in cell wall biosynthesis
VAPRYGGPSQAVVEMTRALARTGVDVLVATTDADGPGGRLRVPLGALTSYRDVPTVFFRRQWSESFMLSLPLARWLSAHVAEFDAVHLHAVFTHACLAAAAACRRWQIPYVIRPLGTLDRWSRQQKPLRKWIVWQVAARSMVRHAAAVHYTTADERGDVEASLRLDRGVVIPLGVDERLADGPDRATDFRRNHLSLGTHPYILILCRIHPVKALESFLDAFANVTGSAEFADWRLVIAGGGDADYTASLVQRARELGTGSRVLFTGWIDGTAKQGALLGSSLLALASRHENFGVSIAEALVCGVPVLVSDRVKLAAEIEAAGAGWVAPLDPGALEYALRDALRSEPERAMRGAAGRQLALERYSWRRVATDLSGVYESIVRQPAPLGL